MHQWNRIAGILFLILFVQIAPCAVAAQKVATITSAPELTAPLRPDLEVDLVPYFLHGYSAHVGIGRSHWRIEGEALRTDVPEWMHGNPGFDLSYQGGGFKTQYFLSSRQKGTFVGARTEIVRESVKLRNTGFEAQPMRYSLGIDAGYRFYFDKNLYITPWGGLDYTFDACDILLANKTFKERPLGFFAAVHFGYRF
jgi:hypothetical protein